MMNLLIFLMIKILQAWTMEKVQFFMVAASLLMVTLILNNGQGVISTYIHTFSFLYISSKTNFMCFLHTLKQNAVLFFDTIQWLNHAFWIMFLLFFLNGMSWSFMKHGNHWNLRLPRFLHELSPQTLVIFVLMKLGNGCDVSSLSFINCFVSEISIIFVLCSWSLNPTFTMNSH